MYDRPVHDVRTAQREAGSTTGPWGYHQRKRSVDSGARRRVTAAMATVDLFKKRGEDVRDMSLHVARRRGSLGDDAGSDLQKGPGSVVSSRTTESTGTVDRPRPPAKPPTAASSSGHSSWIRNIVRFVGRGDGASKGSSGSAGQHTLKRNRSTSTRVVRLAQRLQCPLPPPIAIAFHLVLCVMCVSGCRWGRVMVCLWRCRG